MGCCNDEGRDRELKEFGLFSLASVWRRDVIVLYKYIWEVTNRKGKNY